MKGVTKKSHIFRAVLLSVVYLSITYVVLTGSVLAAQLTTPYTFTSGTTISSSQMNANFTAIQNAVDPLQVSNYWQFGNLNKASVNVGTSWTPLNIGTLSFTKSRSDTKIEVLVNSNFYAGTFSGALGIQFEVRIDGQTPVYGTTASILTSGATQFQSIYGVFQGLAAGSHTISLVAIVPNSGSSNGVYADPGGWGGKIIVKESGI